MVCIRVSHPMTAVEPVITDSLSPQHPPPILFVGTWREDPPGMAFAYASIGEGYACKADFEKVLFHFEKALEVFLAVDGQDHSGVTLFYKNIGMKQGKYEEALPPVHNWSRRIVIC